MPKKRKPAMTKVVPVKMSDALYERLQRIAERVGEADSTIIRLVLFAGLLQIERDNFQLFKFEEQTFETAGEKPTAPAGGRSSGSTRESRGPDEVIAARINEPPTASSAPSPRGSEPSSKPRVTGARARLRKMIEREKRKAP